MTFAYDMKCYGNNDASPLKLNCEILNENVTCQYEVAWYYLKASDQGKMKEYTIENR